MPRGDYTIQRSCEMREQYWSFIEEWTVAQKDD